MTHQEKIDFACENMLVSYPPWDGSNFQPYNVSSLAARLGLMQQTLLTGDSIIANKRLDRLIQFLELALKVGIPREHMAIMDEPLTEGVFDEDDGHISISHGITDQTMSESEWYTLLHVGMKNILLRNELEKK